jgi:hypothetical protein
MGRVRRPNPQRAGMSRTVTAERPVGDRTVNVSLFGGRKLTGRWRPAEHMIFVSVIGGCHRGLLASSAASMSRAEAAANPRLC